MGTPSAIHGFITTPCAYPGFEKIREQNVNALRSLPERDSWPPLSQGMVGISGPSVLEGSYDYDMIHLGLVLKNPDDRDLRLWIAKFENFLKSLIFFDADLRLHPPFQSERHFQWHADEAEIAAIMQTKQPTPIRQWVFEDGGLPLE